MFEKGYNGTGVKDLADAAGIPKGSLYNYFKNKEDYAKEAVLYYYKEMSKEKFEVLSDKNLKPLDRIKKFYSDMIKEFDCGVNCKLGCFVGNLTQEMGGISDLLGSVVFEIHGEIVDKLENCLKEAVRDGSLSYVETSSLAEFITNSWQGTLIRIKAGEDKKALEDFYKILEEVLLK